MIVMMNLRDFPPPSRDLKFEPNSLLKIGADALGPALICGDAVVLRDMRRNVDSAQMGHMVILDGRNVVLSTQ